MVEDTNYRLNDIVEPVAQGGFVIEDFDFTLTDIREPVAQGGFVVSNFFISKKN